MLELRLLPSCARQGNHILSFPRLRQSRYDPVHTVERHHGIFTIFVQRLNGTDPALEERTPKGSESIPNALSSPPSVVDRGVGEEC